MFFPLIWKTVRREKCFAGPLVESYFSSCLLVEVNDRSAFWYNEQACQNCGGLYISARFGLPKSFLLLSTDLVLQPKILAKSNSLSNVIAPYYLDQVTVHFLPFNAQYPASHGHPSKATLSCWLCLLQIKLSVNKEARLVLLIFKLILWDLKSYFLQEWWRCYYGALSLEN